MHEGQRQAGIGGEPYNDWTLDVQAMRILKERKILAGISLAGFVIAVLGPWVFRVCVPDCSYAKIVAVNIVAGLLMVACAIGIVWGACRPVHCSCCGGAMADTVANPSLPPDAEARVSQKLKICRHCHRYVLVGGKAAKNTRR